MKIQIQHVVERKQENFEIAINLALSNISLDMFIDIKYQIHVAGETWFSALIIYREAG